jgi:hypothetical protein
MNEEEFLIYLEGINIGSVFASSEEEAWERAQQEYGCCDRDPIYLQRLPPRADPGRDA